MSAENWRRQVSVLIFRGMSQILPVHKDSLSGFQEWGEGALRPTGPPVRDTMYHELGHSPVQHGTSCQGLEDDQQCTKTSVDGPIKTPRALQEDEEDTQGTQAPF